jgi:microcompartment protein CcmL/EutN
VTKRWPALAALELEEVSSGLFATDAMLKKAPIGFVRSGTLTRGRWLTLIGGSTASVEESYAEGLFCGGALLADSVLLPDVHAELFDGVLGARKPPGPHALVLFETPTVSRILLATEVALKGTGVALVEVRLGDSGLFGKGIAILSGELHDVEAAIDMAVSRVPMLRHHVIPRPHEGLLEGVSAGTAFHRALLLDLDGEKG